MYTVWVQCIRFPISHREDGNTCPATVVRRPGPGAWEDVEVVKTLTFTS